MEAAPRLPMLEFELKTCPEGVQFGPKLKPYIATFYNEDPESYNSEIYNLECLRASATHPTMDVNGVQLLKKYYCQLHFLKSRFPMEDGQVCTIQFPWNVHTSSGMSCGTADIKFEQMMIMYNIGALHSHLGAQDPRSNPEGMKMACTHFQCAAWAFQNIKEKHSQYVSYISSMELIHFCQQVCLAQAQECILEKSMLDNRKPTIIAKVAVQVYDYYRQSLSMLQSANDEMCGKQKYKEWTKYLQFKIAYHRCISLLYQGQQAEEQQKMGERVAFYQTACEHLEEARKIASGLKNNQKELVEAITFTTDVVEGKRKAAKNENEFIYHEEVPDLAVLQEVKGAALVKGIPFSVNDTEVSGPDIFARLVPMEAHEASSLYSEKKAQLLREIGAKVENKDQQLAEFMSSMPLDFLTKMRQATGIPQEIIDRAAAVTAKPTLIKDLMDVMGKLSGIYQDVEGDLKEIDELLKEEEANEKFYQEKMGKRPPSIVATDLSREAAKYREAHAKANESNQTLHRAMTAHVANLKILQQPLKTLLHQLPSVEMPNPSIDESSLKELESLNSKVEEMRMQRAMLWAQLREAVHNDDITGSLVTKHPIQSQDELFQKELEKHQQLISVLEQNLTAQDNIKNAFVDSYAKAVHTRRYIQDIISRRNSTVQALISSYDAYEDLLAKANKGIEFYTKLQTNVSKLLQRIKSASKVQQEERDQILTKNELKDDEPIVPRTPASTPKLKDYLEARKKASNTALGDPNLQYPVNYPTQNPSEIQNWPTYDRPAPIGSSNEPSANEPRLGSSQYPYSSQNTNQYPANYQLQSTQGNIDALTDRMNSLLSKQSAATPQYTPPYSYSSYIPQNYPTTTYTYSTQQYTAPTSVPSTLTQSYDPTKAFTSTTNSYQPIPSYVPQSNTNMQYPDSALNSGNLAEYPQYNQAASYNNQAVSYNNQATNYNNQSGYTQNSQTMTGYSGQVSYPENNQAPISNVSYQPSPGNTAYPQVTQANLGVGYIAQPGMENGGYSEAASSVGQNSYMQNTQVTQNIYPQEVGSASAGGFSDSSYYPPGYDPNYTSHIPTQTSFPSVQQYYNQQYATSVQQDTVNINYASGTYSSPVVNLSNSQSGETSYMSPSAGQTNTGYTYDSSYTNPNQNYNYTYGQDYQTTQNYGNISGQDYTSTSVSTQNNQVANYAVGQTYSATNPQLATSTYNYPTSQTPVQQQTVPVTKESNLDLLSGLDFTINQAPLVPQQNITPAKPKEEPKPVPTESKPASASPVKSKEEIKPTRRLSSVKILPSKRLDNQDVKNLFNLEIDKYEKYVETLTNKTLSGPTNLDIKWKEIQDKQDNDSSNRIISVARCYPMKNRFPDILPFDACRVELEGAKDDYINASYVKEVSPFAPQFIVTQAPLQSTSGDFWLMVKEQQVELILCLANDKELGDNIYWPMEKGQNLNFSNMVITLQSVIVKTNWTERLISVAVPEKKESRVVMHIQFTSWPGSLFPTTPEPFVSLVLELISLFQQQRSITHPIVLHCMSSIGRTGLMCLLMTAILEVTNNANAVPDLSLITSKLSSCHRNILRDREHLKFGYEAFLWYMKQVVEQDKTKKKLSEIVLKKEEVIQPSAAEPVEKKPEDPLSALDPLWATKK